MMATHDRSGINRWLLGSVAEKVLRGTSNPLLLVRAPCETPPDGHAVLSSIVVPLDGSNLAETVLPSVVDLARTRLSRFYWLRIMAAVTFSSFGDAVWAEEEKFTYRTSKDDLRIIYDPPC